MNSGSIGRSRAAKNVFQLWKQVFVSSGTQSSAKANPHALGGKGKKPGAKAGAGVGGGGGGGGGGAAGGAAAVAEDRQQELLRDLQHADSQRVMDGVVEHYLTVPFTDPQMVCILILIVIVIVIVIVDRL